MMNARPARGPRLFNSRLAVVVILFLVTAGGIFMTLAPQARGTDFYALAEGRTLEAGASIVRTDFVTVTLPGDSDIESFVTDSELDTLLAREPILLNSLAAGDYLRESDIFTPALDEEGNPLPGYETGRLTSLLKGNNRIVSIAGDPTTTFAKAGDRLDIYQVTGGGAFVEVNLCFSKKILYVVPRVIPSGSEANGYTPSGTSFILDLGEDPSGLTPDQLAAALIKLQESGKIRVALGSPSSAPAVGSCSGLFPVLPTDGVTDGTLTPSPLPSPVVPSPSPSAP
jgi:hypothetical protein